MRKLTGGMAAALLIVLVFPAPAQAATEPGPSWVHDQQSLINGQDVKAVRAQCPPGEHLFGIGGWTTPGGHALLGIVPNPELTEVIVSAREQSGAAALWSVTARAVCGPDGPYRTVREGLSTATTGCNGTDIVYSSGFLLREPTPATYVTSVIPSVLLYDVTVTAAGDATVDAIAICGPQPDNKARSSATSPLDSSPTKLAVAGRPDNVLAGEGAIFGGGILIRGTNAFVDGFTPNETLDGFKGRASRPGSITPLSLRAMANTDDEDDWDTVTYGTCIGHWYAIPV